MIVPTPGAYDPSDTLAPAALLVAPWTQSTATPEPNRLDVAVAGGDLVAAVAALTGAGWGRLSAVTGLDLKEPPGKGGATPGKAGATPGKAGAGGPRTPGRAPVAAAPAAPTTDDLEVLYHFCEGPAVLTLRVRVDRAAPVVPSLHSVLSYAGFYERELHELFGVAVEGAPNLDRLLLSDDWPSDVFPLRKDAVMPPTSAT